MLVDCKECGEGPVFDDARYFPQIARVMRAKFFGMQRVWRTGSHDTDHARYFPQIARIMRTKFFGWKSNAVGGHNFHLMAILRYNLVGTIEYDRH